MKTLITKTCAGYSRMISGCAAAFALFAALGQSSADQPAVGAEAPAHRSVFQDEKGIGRDPFFPNSTRRLGPVPTQRIVEVVNHNLSLKGISGTKEKRLAIINNRTFEIGEEADLRISGQLLKVKCMEIRERSVVISVNGSARELFLAQKL